MLDKKSFTDMELYLKEEDQKREEIIGKCRIILKNSKSAIYCIHRKELKESKRLLDESEKIILELKKITAIHPHLTYSMDNALQEYCEAYCFYYFVSEKRIPSNKEMKLDVTNYLAGISDLTGELARMAVIEATAKNSKQVKIIRDLIDEVYGQYIKFDLRNGELRKKSDSIKWNLNKVEELLYDLKRKEK